MTHPHRWLRAAHKIAPNGALFPVTSYYRLSCTERSRPFPTNCRKASNYRQNACSRRVCRGRIYASRGVYPIYRITGAVATGGIVAVPTAKAFPLGGRWRGTRRMRGEYPAVAPSSVTFGDSFPRRGKPYGWFIGTKNRDCAARFPGIFVQLYDFEKNVDKQNQLGLK